MRFGKCGRVLISLGLVENRSRSLSRSSFSGRCPEGRKRTKNENDKIGSTGFRRRGARLALVSAIHRIAPRSFPRMSVQRISGRIVDVLQREEYPGTVEIAGGIIRRIRRDRRPLGPGLIMPGLV